MNVTCDVADSRAGRLLMLLVDMLTSLNRYDFQPHHFRLLLYVQIVCRLGDKFPTGTASVASRSLSSYWMTLHLWLGSITSRLGVGIN